MKKVFYTDITKEIISLMKNVQDEHNILSHINFKNIRFVLSDYVRNVDYYGYCHANDPIYMPYTNKNIMYIVEIVYNNIKHFDIDRLIVLILHELMHIPKGGFDFNNKMYLETIDHDYNEFCKIVKLVNGIDWTDRRKKMPYLIKNKEVIIKKNGISFKKRR